MDRVKKVTRKGKSLQRKQSKMPDLLGTFGNLRWGQTLITLGPRILVQVVLLTTFLYFFGFPAVARFAKKEVMVVET